MASKSKSDTKTVERYSKNGTKVTVSEETAAKLGAKFVASKPKQS